VILDVADDDRTVGKYLGRDRQCDFDSRATGKYVDSLHLMISEVRVDRQVEVVLPFDETGGDVSAQLGADERVGGQLPSRVR
jgi:hypothetical protein